MIQGLGLWLPLVNDQVPIDQILDLCGVRRHHGGESSQAQCPFHKDGGETRWSARIYKDSNRLWCYTEQKMYTVLDLLTKIRGMPMSEAVEWAVSKYPIDESKKPVERVEDPVQVSLEKKLQLFRGKADLKTYTKAALAITLAGESLDTSVKVVLRTKAESLLNEMAAARSTL